MARRTKLQSCVHCGQPVELGVYIGFYVVGIHGPQFKQTWPAHGHCRNCLLRLAGKWGLTTDEIDRLRQKLQSSAQKPKAGRTA